MKKNKIFNVLTNILFYSFIIILSLMLIFSIVNNKKGKETSLLGYKFYTVLSESMTPTLNKGTIIAIKKADVKIGDIITFKPTSESSNTTHRIIKINEAHEVTYVTKGDNNKVEDPKLVTENRIVGKVEFSIPYVGLLIESIKSNLFTSILIISLLILVVYVIKYKLKFGRAKNE
ncbi:signal peptidase I [Clostridium gasigenes]|uniref:signal peptidase I n=1 Tax=Clostridium gasigenes TaxID=94869 RepID=UPI001C0D57DD|nr:signal peptidase I [Clostridium gasigenes]MBU3136065.1 signal peptidase I [Clostridium gasigenes]